MVVRALWRLEALNVVPWLRPLRAPDIHNARPTILNPFETKYVTSAVG